MSGHSKRFIYFCGSIRGGREDAALYRRIIDQLKEYGDVLTEHIGDADVLDKDQGLRHSLQPRAKLKLNSASYKYIQLALVVIFKLILVSLALQYLNTYYSYVGQ